MLTNDGLVIERPFDVPFGVGGTQRVYRWGNFGLSAVNVPGLHDDPSAWEIAVITFGDESGESYRAITTPLTDELKTAYPDE